MTDAILSRFDVSPDDLLGEGGEARVYALDADRVLRVHREGTPEITVVRRRELLDELQLKAGSVNFDIPCVIDIEMCDDGIVTIEARLPGENMLDVLAGNVPDRKGLLRSYLTASKQISDLSPGREWYGDLVRDEAIHTQSFMEYALARAYDSLHRAGVAFAGVRVVEIGDAMIEAPKALVHMDICPGNVLIQNNRVSAVLDFGVSSIIGDRRIDPIAAVAYLDPEITPAATDEDRSYAMTWLQSHELHTMYEPVKRWLAAFWSVAGSDAELNAWCRRVLVPGA